MSDRPAQASLLDLFGAASVVEAVGTSGSAWVVYGQLVRAEVVIPPGRPVASEKGRATVAEWQEGR